MLSNTKNIKYNITYKEILSFSLFTVIIYFILRKSKENRINDNANTKKVQDAFNTNSYNQIFNNSTYKNLKEYLDKYGITKEQIQKILENIYNAKGIINDDEDIVYSIFRQLPSIFMISIISKLFEEKYKTSLKLYLSTFLSEKELDVIHRIINNKKYI